MEQTAMAARLEDSNNSEGRKRAEFEQAIEHFMRTWAPRDPYDRAQFEAALFSIVRQIYRDAQEPVLKALSNAAFGHNAMGLLQPKPIRRDEDPKV